MTRPLRARLGTSQRTRREPFVPPPAEEGYVGPACLVVGEQWVQVQVALRDHVEPLDGRTHWYGRVQGSPEVTALKDEGATVAELVVGDGAAPVRLAEFDAWGNVGVRGVGVPPYAGEVSPGE